MLNGRRYVGLALLLTGSREARYRSVIVDIDQAVARYMLGNVAISLLATVATWLGRRAPLTRPAAATRPRASSSPGVRSCS